jgi:acetyl/propionyl-CoA carboxylase alpha subunit
MGLDQASKRKALLLGHTVESRRILKALEAEGFVPERVPDPLPSVLDPEAARHFQKILAGFQGHYLHPGVGIWADRPELVSIAQRAGLILMAPSARVLTLFGNKLNFLHEAESIGIPHLVIPPGEPIHSLREIEDLIESQRFRFPFVLKSALGPSALGLIVIQDSRDLETKLPLWIEQLRRSAGEVILFGERYMEGAHLVSVPFARLLDGRSETFPWVDGSLQSRYRKVVEFCPVEGMEASLENQLSQWTLKLAERVGYVGVGSLDFLIDGSRPHLVGGLARLDSNFALWEQVAGTSAIAWQVAALAGGAKTPLPIQGPAAPAALGLKLYAEDPILQLPQPGIVREVSELKRSRAELALAVEPGSEVSPTGYGLIGALWITAENREQAVLTARGLLDQLWIAGSLQTNERFLSELLAHPWVREGMFHAGFIDEEFLPSLRPSPELLPIFAGVMTSASPDQFNANDRWVVSSQWVRPGAVQWLEGPFLWTGHCKENGVSGRIQAPDGRRLRVCAFPCADSKWLIRIGQWVMMTRRVPPKSQTQSPAPREPKLYSLIPGRVHAVFYRNGAHVPAHEPLLIVESLGMLIPHALPSEVRVKRWKVSAEEQVFAGQELAELEMLTET